MEMKSAIGGRLMSAASFKQTPYTTCCHFLSNTRRKYLHFFAEYQGVFKENVRYLYGRARTRFP